MEEYISGTLGGQIFGEFGSAQYVPLWQSFVGPVSISCSISLNPVMASTPCSMRILINHDLLATIHPNQTFSFTIAGVYTIGVIGTGLESGAFTGNYCVVLHSWNHQDKV